MAPVAWLSVEEVSAQAASPFTRDLVRWSETLAAIARTGLGFSENLYERERFEEVLNVAADIKAAANQALGGASGPDAAAAADAAEDAEDAEVIREQDHFVQEWLESVGVGVPGYVTPKVAIGAVVGNDHGELLLVQRKDSGIWLYPTGWADVGYSPAEVAVKEVAEETGVECLPERVLAVIDGQRMGFSRFGMYMLLFHCRAVGGELTCHPLECADVGSAPTTCRRPPPGRSGGRRWPSRRSAVTSCPRTSTRCAHPSGGRSRRQVSRSRRYCSTSATRSSAWSASSGVASSASPSSSSSATKYGESSSSTIASNRAT